MLFIHAGTLLNLKKNKWWMEKLAWLKNAEPRVQVKNRFFFNGEYDCVVGVSRKTKTVEYWPIKV